MIRDAYSGSMKNDLHIPDFDDLIVQEKIYIVRGKKVMLDKDLAKLYGVEAKRLNEAVKRNSERFPSDFMFTLNKGEMEILSRSQIATLKMPKNKAQLLKSTSASTLNKRGGNIKYQPFAFTEQGIAMLSSVLHSNKAIQINIQIIRIFTKMRDMVEKYKDLDYRINKLEELLSVLIQQEEEPKTRIGFDTQV